MSSRSLDIPRPSWVEVEASGYTVSVVALYIVLTELSPDSFYTWVNVFSPYGVVWASTGSFGTLARAGGNGG